MTDNFTKEELQSEQWLPVVGNEERYHVSSLGRIRSIDRSVTNSNGITRNVKGKIRKATPQRNGYLKVNMGFDDGQKTRTVHRMVLTAFVENPGLKEDVSHVNSDKTDNRLANLEWATRQENNKHALAHGTRFDGKPQSNSKSGVTGVIWCGARSKWIANVIHEGKSLSLGSACKLHAVANLKKILMGKLEKAKADGNKLLMAKWNKRIDCLTIQAQNVLTHD